jgi:hypothetical protein
VICFDEATFRPCGFVDNPSALPTSPQGQQQKQQKRTIDVLPKPDNSKSYRQARAVRRCGELLKQYSAEGRQDRPLKAALGERVSDARFVEPLVGDKRRSR